ncbi:VOC family protein [Mycobacterium sp. IDR2000157661]|uniref:VOC family protein n=1 Tax=Mycobacterium sp. IDR2000157661 TaxID=2867005 RepID=UPI001EEAA80A|nr:VOC family protein [Mycobacterium sp. IDR2000157661]ULE32951.1 VOC family protein [Mycobacterium sp. IDR2000157661]
MTEPGPIRIENFSHVCVGVSEIDRSLRFYREVLGMDVVFDVALDGASLSAVTGRAGESGRMVGGLIGGMMVELLALGDVPRYAEGPHIGYTNISLRVADVDAAHRQLQAFDGVRCLPPVEIGGVRMMFVYDPDDTPIELVELPGGAATTDELWRPAAE